MLSRPASAALSCALLSALWMAPAAAQTRLPETAYYTADHGSSNTYLLKPLAGSNVRLTNHNGWAKGTVAVAGLERQVVLDRPIRSEWMDYPDSCGQPYTRRRSVEQVIFRRTEGTDNVGRSEVVEIGNEKVMDGCDAGQLTPFGSPTDAGTPVSHLAMKRRPGITDVVEGTQLAGPTAVALDPGAVFGARQSVISLQAGGLARFEDSGLTVPSTQDANGWLVLDFGSYQNAFTRLAKDRTTLAETWLTASYVNGEPTLVRESLFVAPRPDAGFGTKREASRRWESGLFVGSNTPFFFDLYNDYTGNRISRTIDPPSETYIPLTWAFSGPNLVTTRARSPGVLGIRTWVPVANKGIYRWVIEDEVTRLADGTNLSLIEPRVNFYIDEGASVKPAAAPLATRQAGAARQPARGLQLQP